VDLTYQMGELMTFTFDHELDAMLQEMSEFLIAGETSALLPCLLDSHNMGPEVDRFTELPAEEAAFTAQDPIIEHENQLRGASDETAGTALKR
jgi:hypothetical protein